MATLRDLFIAQQEKKDTLSKQGERLLKRAKSIKPIGRGSKDRNRKDTYKNELSSKEFDILLNEFKGWYDGNKNEKDAFVLADIMFAYNKVTIEHNRLRKEGLKLDKNYFNLLDNLRHILIRNLDTMPLLKHFLIGTAKKEGEDRPYYGKVNLRRLNEVVFNFKSNDNE